jgi:hypothetical protein
MAVYIFVIRINIWVATVVQLAPINEYLGIIKRFRPILRIAVITENFRINNCFPPATPIFIKKPESILARAANDNICSEPTAGAKLFPARININILAKINNAMLPAIAKMTE